MTSAQAYVWGHYISKVYFVFWKENKLNKIILFIN